MACGLQASMGLSPSGGHGMTGQDSNGKGGMTGGLRTSASDPNQGQGPGDGTDVWAGSHGNVPRNKDARNIKANAVPVMAKGERREGGKETYVEVRGPASVGARSKVPYQKALPTYKKRAEEAMATKKIPKSKQKRVKEYFESLQRGRK